MQNADEAAGRIQNVDNCTKYVRFKKMQIESINNNNILKTQYQGAQWLSGRVLDSRPKGRGFEPHRRHCVVVLEQDTFILA